MMVFLSLGNVKLCSGADVSGVVKRNERRWFAGSQGPHGMYASLNWAVEIVPYVHLEADALTGRTFEVMPHWEFGGRLGISTRF